MKARCDRCGVELDSGQLELQRSAEPKETRGTVDTAGRKKAYRLCPRCRNGNRVGK